MSTRGRRFPFPFLFVVLLVWSGPAAPQMQPLGVAVAVDPAVAAAAIVGTHSVHLHSGTQVSGNVVANEALAGPTLVTGATLRVDRDAAVGGDVFGDRVSLARGSTVQGDVHANQLADAGAAIGGGVLTPLVLPVLAPLPPFQEAAIRAGAPDVTVAAGTTVALSPGDYGDLAVEPFGTVHFTGGLYNLRSVQALAGATCAFPCRVFSFGAPAELRVAGRFDTGRAASLGPAAGSGASAAQIVVYVGGVNGGAGGPADLPAAVTVGRDSVVEANIYAPGGTLRIERDAQVTGALLGRDVDVDQGTSVTRASAFANLPPVAEPGIAYTQGAGTIEIVLRASDPEGEDLTFDIVAEPAFGTLGAVSQGPAPFPGNPPGCNPDTVPGCIPPEPPRISATVTYTPDGAGNVEDSFTFAAQDPHGAAGTAVVRINPAEPPEPPQPPLDTVRALDGTTETLVEATVAVRLAADAPDGVELIFALASSPAHGTLGALVQGSETPRRSATVPYTPGDGFEGSDSFEFTACGTIAGATVCDQATATIVVAGRLAEDQQVETAENTELAIQLGGNTGAGSAAAAVRRLVGRAAFLDGAEIAGNVADEDGDGFGDQHNALPGAAPVLMSAGVDLTGGEGSNGTVRMQIEWDISALGGLSGSLESAAVTLSTNRGTIDTLDTFFFAGASDGNGALDDADFELPAVQIPGAVMPVPGVAVGTDGTFTFDVTAQFANALAADRAFFVVQGRVDEQLANGSPQRGLQVRTTAAGNLLDHSEPQLAIATPGVTPPELAFSVVSLPLHGSLRTSLGTLITAVPFALDDRTVLYAPAASFVGADGFDFQVEDLFANTATATVSILVSPFVDPCAANGREPGCLP